MGQLQHTSRKADSASSSAAAPRLRPRVCLRKDCGRQFQPNRHNQKYCQDPECLRLLRRWQAAKRQQRRRAHPDVRQQHADAQRERRARQREECRCQETATAAEPELIPAEQSSRAWSRSNVFSRPFCDRPGCYEPVRTSYRAPARYCSNACRQAVRRVRDRERKWLRRSDLRLSRNHDRRTMATPRARGDP